MYQFKRKEEPKHRAVIFRGMDVYKIEIFDDEALSALHNAAIQQGNTPTVPKYRIEMSRGSSLKNLDTIEKEDNFTMSMLIDLYVDSEINNSCSLQEYLNSTYP